MASKRIAENPNEVLGYNSLAWSCFLTDRFSEAKSSIQRASGRKLEASELLLIQYVMAVLQGDQREMDRSVALARGKPRSEHWMAYEESLALARSGRLRAARQSSNRAVELVQQTGEVETSAAYQAARAVWEAECGKSAEAKRDAMAALALSTGRDVEYAAGLALALSGDFSGSQPLADDLEKRFPEDTFVKFTYVPVLRAFAGLEQGKPADSVKRLEITLRYEFAGNGLNFSHLYLGGLHSAYVRGNALMAEHRYAEAVAEFQKILDHPGIVGADPIGALSHLQIGRAFALSEDKVKAKTAYDAFLSLWKNAEPDVPILKSARAEYEKL